MLQHSRNFSPGLTGSADIGKKKNAENVVITYRAKDGKDGKDMPGYMPGERVVADGEEDLGIQV